MDEVWKLIAPSLGAFLPAAALGWWVIRSQQQQIKEERDTNKELTERVFKLGETTATVLTEMRRDAEARVASTREPR